MKNGCGGFGKSWCACLLGAGTAAGRRRGTGDHAGRRAAHGRPPHRHHRGTGGRDRPGPPAGTVPGGPGPRRPGREGQLPPVSERLPAEPLVIEPLHAIGTYGGTWHRGFTGPADRWSGYRCCAFDTLTFVDFRGEKLVPNVVKAWQVSDDGRTFTLFLRPGMKWSDGAPFTADDFVFWYRRHVSERGAQPDPAPDHVHQRQAGRAGENRSLLDSVPVPGTLPPVSRVARRFHPAGRPGLPGALSAWADTRRTII